MLHEVQSETESKNGFTRQWMHLAAIQRDDNLWAAFASEVSLHNADMFIFLDERVAHWRDALRQYAYSWRRKPSLAHKLILQGEWLSSIAIIMKTTGVLDSKVLAGTVDGDIFLQLCRKSSLLNLMLFNGVNPHSIVVLDNASMLMALWAW